MASFGNRNGGDDGFSSRDLGRMGRRIARALGSRLASVILLVLVLFAGWTSYYQIQPEEVGLITRFGAYVSTSEQIFRVPVKRQLKEEFGFRTHRAAVRTEYEDLPQVTDRESRMLSGDLNIADVEWIVQYRIADAYKYVFNVRGMGNTLRDMAESSMRKVVGDHSVSEILTIGRESIQEKAKRELQSLCDRYGTGVHIEQLVLQDVNPPKPVRESFNEVNQAIQERQRAVNQAWAQYNSVIPKARGSALQTVQAAEGYATERVNKARGEVARFLSVQLEYAKAPLVTRSRIYLETMSEVIPRAERRTFIDDRLKGLLPLLPLGSSSTNSRPAP
jgi:membrane protease subunit HflK